MINPLTPILVLFVCVCISAQKNTHYLLVFDAFVILMCLTSAVLCTRSIILAVRLLQVSNTMQAATFFLFSFFLFEINLHTHTVCVCKLTEFPLFYFEEVLQILP